MHKEQQNYWTSIANFYNILNPYFELQIIAVIATYHL